MGNVVKLGRRGKFHLLILVPFSNGQLELKTFASRSRQMIRHSRLDRNDCCRAQEIGDLSMRNVTGDLKERAQDWRHFNDRCCIMNVKRASYHG